MRSGVFTTLILVAIVALLMTGCSQISTAEDSPDVRNAALEVTHPDLGSLPRSRLFVGSDPNYAMLLWWENLGGGELQGEMRLTQKLEPEEEELDGQPREAVFASYTSYFTGIRDGDTIILGVRSRLPYAPVGEWTGELLRGGEAAEAPQRPALRLVGPDGIERTLFPAGSEQAYAEAVANLTQVGP